MVQLSSLLHSGYAHPVLRSWQSDGVNITKDSLIYPLFIAHDDNQLTEITTMPGQFRVGINRLQELIAPLMEKGLKSVLLFGVPDDNEKDLDGTCADTDNATVIKATRTLRGLFPNLVIACDVCLCEYTDHGHCGYIDNEGFIDNCKTVKRLAEMSLAFAKAGCNIIAPSDMMDGRIQAIKKVLFDNNLSGRVSVMSYSAKFSSVFYGPFRDAANSAPSKGDRKRYQLPPFSRGLARRALLRDANEGADMLIVKPGYPYLDIVRDAKELCPDIPIAVYQVSGEYAMLCHSAKAGVFQLQDAVLESLGSAMRAGANIFITYFTPQLLDWLPI